MHIEIPHQAAEILSVLEREGFEAYMVGGCVRDSLMGKEPADWDITTSARPEEIIACFGERRIVETSLRHGTVTVVLGQTPYEVTTLRVDGAYSDNRRPDSVTFTDDLREDLARRDFTINAMAWNPESGLIDPFGGREDIRGRRIRCVGNPVERFREDALRILRAVRFASVLDFAVDEATAAAMEETKGLLKKIAVERIRVELDKALAGDGIERAFSAHSAVLLEVLPELRPCVGFDQRNRYHHLDVWAHSLRAVSASGRDPRVRLALLLHDCGKPRACTVDGGGTAHFYGHAAAGAELSRRILARLKYDNHSRLWVERLVADHATPIQPTQKAARRWLNRLGEEGFRALLMVKRADAKARADWCVAPCLESLDRLEQALEEVLLENQCYRLKDLAVDGDDLLAMGMVKGREIGILLAALLDEVIDGRLPNDKDVLIGYAREWIEDND